MFKITKKEVLTPVTKLIEVEAPLIAAKCLPGQFVSLIIDEKGERIPLTIADFNKEKGLLTIVFQEVGVTTIRLGLLKENDSIKDLIGPLGKPFPKEKYGNIISISGGVGIAPMFPIIRILKEEENKITSIVGARSKELLFWEDKISRLSSETYITTDDGTKGRKGLVTDVLKELIQNKTKVDIVIAIGPVIMMREVSKITKVEGIKTIVSLNPIMVDGTGMCGACRVTVNGETKFTCVDGPDFDGFLVDYDELMKRQRIYLEEEKRALDKIIGEGK